MRLPETYLTKREQQIMEILYRDGAMSANDLMGKLPGQPSNSSVRTQLRILEEKGAVKHEVVDGKFVYSPVHDREEAAESALSTLVTTFFKGSITQAVAALLSQNETKLDAHDLAELEALILKAKEDGR